MNHRPQSPHQDEIPIRVHHEKKPFTGKNNTTEIPSTHQKLPESPRLERAHSEPPKTMTAKINRLQTPTVIPENEDENSIKTSASAPSVPSNNSPVPPPRRTSPPKEHVRHIPIIVEGRDTPVYSRKTSEPTRNATVHETPARRPGSLTTSNPTPPKQEPTSPISPPPGPIPMGWEDKKKDPEPNSPQPMPPGPIPLPCSPNLMETDGGNPSIHAVHPNSDESSSAVDPAMEKVQSIRENLKDIKNRIDNFQGSKKDKEYLYLDDLLTRYLLQLDCIDSGGKEEIRKIRKESIVSVNRCLSLLDHRASKESPSDQAETNNQILSDLAAVSAKKEAT